MLMVAGTNMYRGVHRSSNILFKSVVASNQLQKAIVDSKYPFAVYENNIFVGGSENGQSKINAYIYDEDQGAIIMRVDTLEITGNVVQITQGDPIPFCYNVASVSYNPQINAETNQAYALKFSLQLNKFGVNYNRNETISLRNRPVLITGDSALETEQLLADQLGG